VSFFEHFSSHLSKDGEQLDRWCKNSRIQEKLRIGIDGNGRWVVSETLGATGTVIEMEKIE
jgi:hypothetical protein